MQKSMHESMNIILDLVLLAGVKKYFSFLVNNLRDGYDYFCHQTRILGAMFLNMRNYIARN